MSQADEINKLYDLKTKGLITDDEFEKTKQKILNPSQQTFNQYSETTPAYNQKSRVVYLILAFFFGILGIHNFYVGRTGRGISQLLVTLILGWLFIPLIIVWIWAIADMISIKTDGDNNPMTPASPIILGIILFIELAPVVALVLGLISGFSNAQHSIYAKEVIKYAQSYATAAYNYKQTNGSDKIPAPEEFGLKNPSKNICTISIPQNAIAVSNVRIDINCPDNHETAKAIGELLNEIPINGKISHRFEIK